MSCSALGIVPQPLREAVSRPTAIRPIALVLVCASSTRNAQTSARSPSKHCIIAPAPNTSYWGYKRDAFELLKQSVSILPENCSRPLARGYRCRKESHYALLRKEPGVEVELVNGHQGEFTVLMDDRVVAQKDQDSLPPVERVLEAVREATPAGARV